MRIVIKADPGTWTTITYYDGMNNQIYPPMNIDVFNIVKYIKDTSDEHDINEIVVVGPHVYTDRIIKELENNFKTVTIKGI